MEDIGVTPFEIKVNCKNLTESIGFYSRLGFKVIHTQSNKFYQSVIMQSDFENSMVINLCKYRNQPHQEIDHRRNRQSH